MSRLQANREIVKILAALVECYPDLRFHQLLRGVDITMYDPHSSGISVVRDEYHVESKDVLERVKNSSLLEVQYERE